LLCEGEDGRGRYRGCPPSSEGTSAIARRKTERKRGEQDEGCLLGRVWRPCAGTKESRSPVLWTGPHRAVVLGSARMRRCYFLPDSCEATAGRAPVGCAVGRLNDECGVRRVGRQQVSRRRRGQELRFPGRWRSSPAFQRVDKTSNFFIPSLKKCIEAA